MTTAHHLPLTLSHRLLVALGVVSFLFWAFMATLSTRDNLREVDELYDVHLAYTTKAFLHLTDPDDDKQLTVPGTLSSKAIAELLDMSPESVERLDAIPQRVGKVHNTRKYLYNQSLRYQLWRRDGSLLFRSDNSPLTSMATQTGFSNTLNAQGEGWRNYHVLDANHGVRMIVSEPHTWRTQLAKSMIISAATPLALGLPVLFLLLWFSIRRGLRPLAALSQEIAKRQPDNLTPIDAKSVPDEVKPIVSALNDLLTRMGQTLEHERQFTDDAAHQLRTPLAAIQAQLYTARHTAAEAPHQLALDQMQASVGRGIRLVNQLLALARLDPRQDPPAFSKVNLEEIAETVCAELAPRALQRDQTLELLAAPGLPRVTGNADMLSMLVSNLVDNAIHYTPTGGNITIELRPDGSGVQLVVSDDGPGIAPDQRTRVFERFYRVASADQPGTGLGLSICKRITELHHAPMTLSVGLQGRGLSVCVDFGA